MEHAESNKITRVLGIYTKLLNGGIINKAEEAQNYGVNERSIQRDIDDIRDFLDVDAERTGIINSVIYDRMDKGYRLETLYKLRLKNCEILALCKILLDSRAFVKTEMVEMLDKLITCCVPKSNQKLVKDMQYLFVKSWLPNTKINRTGTRSASNSANHVFFISLYLVQPCTSEKVT